MDFAGYGVTTVPTAQGAYGIGTPVPLDTSDPGINVALVLARNNDPAALLSQPWAERQQSLRELDANGTLWSTYGADSALFNGVVADLKAAPYGLTVLDDSNSNYVTSAESRTIWVAIDSSTEFSTLFGTTLYFSSSDGIWYWDGNLSLPSEWNVAGLWFDTSVQPPPSNMAPGVSYTLPTGPQSIGNSANTDARIFPQDLGAAYQFPLAGSSVETGTIGLIEPATGSFLAGDPTGLQFQARLTEYLAKAGTSGNGTVYVQGLSGQSSATGERSLDVGVVAAINPNSTLGLYNGSGWSAVTGNAQASVFTAVQSSVWDTVMNPAVTTNSWGDFQSMAPGSPFYAAYAGLFVDAALRNQSTVIALGDGGSGNQTGNGLTSLETNVTSPYNLLVGGSSLSFTPSAATDPTLSTIYDKALAADPATIWQLVSGGLTVLPRAGSETWLIETVWNQYATQAGQQFVSGLSYQVNNASSGGIDTTQPMPWYQDAYGIDLTTVAPSGLTGRAAPDVVALAGGNGYYIVPSTNMNELWDDYGTSAASPFWASLVTQFNAVFADQGLPRLGFMTDLLYKAAAVSPGAFNDITMGNNVSSYTLGGTNYGGITPTGYGYYAGPGYDLVSGLGSPNGMLLARALTAIAHSQMFFSGLVPDLVEADGHGGWVSGTAQTLMVQGMSSDTAQFSVNGGSAFFSPASAAYAWTSQLAEQSLQPGFSPELALMFDKQAQGALTEVAVAAGAGVGVSINGTAAQAPRATLTSDAGFADFMTAQGVARLARGIAVAETAGGADDQAAIVRMRQVGSDTLSVTFYKVDDYTGAIGTLHPGDAGYAAAALGRAYQTTAGTTAIAGPGYGQWGQAVIVNVDAGDLVAQVLTDVTWGAVYWGFAQANETAGQGHVGHLWQYGLNTFGWEDGYGGGDRDYNDLVVQLDFTSAAGHGYLV